MPHRSPVQKRLSIYNWNPGPRRGREGAIEKQIAGKWHTITLQEAIEYVDYELLTNRFHVTHHGGCADTRYDMLKDPRRTRLHGTRCTQRRETRLREQVGQIRGSVQAKDNREASKALPQEMAIHLRCHAKCAERRKTGGTSRHLPAAREVTKLHAS